MVLIHVDAPLEGNGNARHVKDSGELLRNILGGLRWYCEWVSEHTSSVYLLLPDHCRSELEPVFSALGHATPLWYADHPAIGLPPINQRSRVWVVNGARLPLVDWEAVDAFGRTVADEVLLFGSSGGAGGPCYAESVLVSDSDEVVQFQRHYDDSPLYTDLDSHEADFLLTNGRTADAVVSHILFRGWGLESIGAMTRRFTIRWSDTPCSSSALGQPGVISGPLTLESLDETPSSDWRRRSPESDRSGPEWDVLHFAKGSAADRSSFVWNPSGNGHALVPARTAESPENTDAQAAVAAASPAFRHVPVSAGPVGKHGRERMYRAAKRMLDVTGAVVGLILLSPLMVVVALMVKLSSRGPIFFAHRRQGLRGAEFPCLKFRSMNHGADHLQAQLRGQNEVDGPQFKITQDPRLTRIGRWLRETNVDELPQLFNVLMGHMSLVGPRPSPDKENQFCPAWRRARLSVKPGITGLWQVLRRREDPDSDFQQWIYYDVAYAENRSLRLDLQLLLYTPVAILAPKYLGRLATRLERRGICTRMDPDAALNGFRLPTSVSAGSTNPA